MLYSDVVYSIKGMGKESFGQKGKYKANTKTGYIKLELTEPMYQLIGVKDGKTYLKKGQQGKLTEVKNSVNQDYMMDIFQYNYFKTYEYKVEEELREGKYKLGGYRDDKKEIEVIYNSEEGVVTGYYILGNEVMPYIAIDMSYDKIKIGESDVIKFPIKMRARVKAKNVTVVSEVKFENVEIR